MCVCVCVCVCVCACVRTFYALNILVRYSKQVRYLISSLDFN